MKTCFFALAILFSALIAGAAELHVGAGQTYTKPSKAAKAAKDGDTIVIHAGSYAGDVCAWTANNLVIRGEGADRVFLDAAGQICQGKAIWVISGANMQVSGITFRGAACADRNGAGIRLEPSASNFVIRGCIFRENENGILCGSISGALTIEYCEFANNGYGNGSSHNLYIGAVDTFVFRHNLTHHANVGHNLKSRAKESIVEGCRFDDGYDGESSYLADFPNGGKVTVRDCVFVQAATTQNGRMVCFGEEGSLPSGSTLTFEGNVMENRRSSGTFVLVQGIGEDAIRCTRANEYIGNGSGKIEVRNQPSFLMSVH